jgi:hypothetical protein
MTSTTPPLAFEGTVWQVDLAGRDVVVRAGDCVRTFQVPPDCVVFVSGEPVKLRLLQPHDRVEVVYRQQGEVAVASSLRVHWLPPPGQQLN